MHKETGVIVLHVFIGPSIKYVTLEEERGLRMCDSLWQERGQEYVTSHFNNIFHTYETWN